MSNIASLMRCLRGLDCLSWGGALVVVGCVARLGICELIPWFCCCSSGYKLCDGSVSSSVWSDVGVGVDFSCSSLFKTVSRDGDFCIS